MINIIMLIQKRINTGWNSFADTEGEGCALKNIPESKRNVLEQSANRFGTPNQALKICLETGRYGGLKSGFAPPARTEKSPVAPSHRAG
jgi:hypothetical protein